MGLTSLRLATPADADGIHDIYAPIVRETAISFEYEPPSRAELVARVQKVSADGYPWIVAESNDYLAGYAYATTFRARTAYSWTAEVSVYVHGNARGSGVGRQLYDVLLRTLELQGFRSAYGVSTAPNPASEALHRAAGFDLIGRLERVGWKFDRWHDALIWRRALGSADVPPAPIRPVADAWAEALAAPR